MPDPILRLAAIVPPDVPRGMDALGEAALKMSNLREAARLAAWANAPVLPDEVTDVGFDPLLYRHGAEGLVSG